MRYANIEYVELNPKNSYKFTLDSNKPRCNACNFGYMENGRKTKRPECGIEIPPELGPSGKAVFPIQDVIISSISVITLCRKVCRRSRRCRELYIGSR